MNILKPAKKRSRISRYLIALIVFFISLIIGDCGIPVYYYLPACNQYDDVVFDSSTEQITINVPDDSN